ncbi:MAG: DUF4465 domain-containing protein [Bacteroidota bacterium]
MTRIFTCLFSFLLAGALGAQTTADFENFTLDPETFLNGSDGNGGFSAGNVFLPNNYNPEFNSWTGFAISNTTDVTDPSFDNQYSAITGEGFDGSSTYAVAFAFDPQVVYLENEAVGEAVNGFYVTNSTVGHIILREGNSIAKKMGGASGTDPDFFLLTIQKFFQGSLSTEKVEFYLADYRSSDSSEDYIIDEWTFVDLSSLGPVDSLLFSLTSSDNGNYGMNTPAYFCVDNFTTSDGVIASTTAVPAPTFSVQPNPTTDWVNVQLEAGQSGWCNIYNAQGQLLLRRQLWDDNTAIEVQHFQSGHYLIEVETEAQRSARWLVKQ